MRDLGAEKITVKVEAQTDEVGDPIPGTESEFEIEGCAVYPTATSEASFRSATVSQDQVLLAPVEETVLAENMTVTRRGKTYSIEGSPVAWLDMRGEIMGTQANLHYGSG